MVTGFVKEYLVPLSFAGILFKASAVQSVLGVCGMAGMSEMEKLYLVQSVKHVNVPTEMSSVRKSRVHRSTAKILSEVLVVLCVIKGANSKGDKLLKIRMYHQVILVKVVHVKMETLDVHKYHALPQGVHIQQKVSAVRNVKIV